MVNIAKSIDSSLSIISLMVYVHILTNKVKHSHAANLFCCFNVHELCGNRNVSEIKKNPATTILLIKYIQSLVSVSVSTQ